MNLKSPGMVRIVKFVPVSINGQNKILMLYYSSYGFGVENDDRLKRLQIAVNEYTPKTFMEIAKGFFSSYEAAYKDNFIYVNKDHQLLSGLVFFKYTSSALKNQKHKIHDEVNEKKIPDAEEYTRKQIEKFESKNLYKKSYFEISDQVAVMPKEEGSKFFKQVAITFLSFATNKEYYLNMTKDQYLKETFPLQKNFTKEELL